MIIFRLKDTVDKVITEEQCGFREGGWYVDQTFTLRLIIEKCLSYQTPLVLSLIDFEQAFNSVDRRALAKVLSLYGIPDKYIKVIGAMYKDITAAVKVGNGVSSWFRIKSEVKQGCVLSPQPNKDHFDGICLKEHRKGNGRTRKQMRRKTLLDLDYADNLIILDERVSKMNEL